MPNFVKHPLIKPNALEARLYQEKILGTAIHKNTLCVLPTGLGKTSIALLLAVYRLEKFPHSKILFMAPTRPLVSQHMMMFRKFLNVNPEEMVVLTGFVNPPERSELYEEKNIIFATPQVIINDIENGNISLKDFSLVIVDEAHRAVGNYAYVKIAREYSQCENALILALTASPGSTRGKIDIIRNNLNIGAVEIRSETDEDVKDWVKEIDVEWRFVELPKEFEEIKKILEEYIEEKMKALESWGFIHSKNIFRKQLLELQKRLIQRVKTNKSAFIGLSLVAEVLKLYHALLLLETQGIEPLQRYFEKMRHSAARSESRAVKRIVNNEKIKKAMEKTETLFNNDIEHPKFDKLKEIVSKQINENPNSQMIIFTNYRATVVKIFKLLKKIKNCRPVSFVGQALKEQTGLTQKEQIERLVAFRDGVYNCIIGTSVSEEGLDIPAMDLAIFYEPIPSEIRYIQRRGRVGRQKAGRVIVLITKKTRDEAFYWSAHHKERKMRDILETMSGKQEKYEKDESLNKWFGDENGDQKN